jgi:hypothetical protein
MKKNFNFNKVETRDQLAWFAGELNTGKAAHQENKDQSRSSSNIPNISVLLVLGLFLDWP